MIAKQDAKIAEQDAIIYEQNLTLKILKEELKCRLDQILETETREDG